MMKSAEAVHRGQQHDGSQSNSRPATRRKLQAAGSFWPSAAAELANTQTVQMISLTKLCDSIPVDAAFHVLVLLTLRVSLFAVALRATMISVSRTKRRDAAPATLTVNGYERPYNSYRPRNR